MSTPELAAYIALIAATAIAVTILWIGIARALTAAHHHNHEDDQ